MSEDKKEQARYESTLRREEMHWKSTVDHAAFSDQAAVDIGINALKTALLINAGALVTLLAFIGTLWDKDNGHQLVSQLLAACSSFVWGTISASVAFAIAYFYQSAITYLTWSELNKISANNQLLPSSSKIERFSLVTGAFMIGLAITALSAFACGAFSVIGVFEKSL